MKLFSSLKSNKWNLNRIISSFLFFSLYFLYVWMWINPVLYYQKQQPVFLTDGNFFSKFTTYPGGIVEYFSLFLSQFYLYPLIGAIIITIIAFLITVASRSLAKTVPGKIQIELINVIPTLLLLFLHSFYEYPITNSVAILFSVFSVLVFIKTASENYIYRILSYLVMSVFIFYVTGGIIILFALLSLLYEFFVRDKIIAGLSYLIIAGLLILSAPYFFLITREEAFLNFLPVIENEGPVIIRYALYIFFPVIMILSFVLSKIKDEKTSKKRKGNAITLYKLKTFLDNRYVVMSQSVLLIMLLILTA